MSNNNRKENRNAECNVKADSAAVKPAFPQFNIRDNSAQDNSESHVAGARFPCKNFPAGKADSFECRGEEIDSGIIESGPLTEEFSDLNISKDFGGGQRQASEEAEDNYSKSCSEASSVITQKPNDIKIIVSEAVPDSGLVQDICESDNDDIVDYSEEEDVQVQVGEEQAQKDIAKTMNDSGLIEDLSKLMIAQSAEIVSKTEADSSLQPECSAELEAELNAENAWEVFYRQEDENGDTALHLAVLFANTKVVAALLRISPHPCLYDIRNDEAMTSMHMAVLTLQPNLVRMLLLAGADATVRDRRGNTALHLAVKSADKQCVRALTEPFVASEIQEAHRQYGHRSHDGTNSLLRFANVPVNTEIVNYDGKRCVHLAAEEGKIEILRILVNHGANINAREGKYGRTPLHIAVDKNNDELLNFLLDECDALDLEAETYAGLTAYQYALINYRHDMEEVLKAHGVETLSVPDSEDEPSSEEDELDLAKQLRPQFGDREYFAHFSGSNPPMPVV